jgi:DNA-binding GntR family transcriptional regulator
MEEIYAARKLIESEVYYEASQHMNNKDIQVLEEILNQLKSFDKRNKESEAFQQLLDEFDLHMGLCSSNKIYSKLMQTIVHLRHNSMVKMLNIPGAMKNSIESRTKLLSAIKERNTDQVKEAIDLNFSRAKQLYSKIE